MSMKRAQEYFAPLRSRHISLQQWERGLLFESWGRRGGRADRRKSGALNGYMAASDSEELEGRPITKVIARSASFSAFGTDTGSEVKSKFFKRGLSFSRSLAPTGEVIPEDSVYHHPPLFRTKTSSGLLFTRSLDSSRKPGHSTSEVEISGGSNSRLEYSVDHSNPLQADRQARPLPKKFFSGSLLFSKDRKFFSGALSFTKSFGRSSDGLQAWDTNNHILGSDCKNRNSSGTDHDNRFKRNFFTRVLSFSRSLDPRGEISSGVRGIRTSYESTEIQSSNKRFGRDLSFSRSLDPKGEISAEDSDNNTSFKGTEIEECKDYFGRELSFSRSLDPEENGDSLSDTSDASATSGGSSTSELKDPELSWSKKFISKSGLFFSRSLDPRKYRESPSKICGTGRFPDVEEIPKDLRSRKLFGRGFSLSFSRFLDPIRNNSSSMNTGTTHRPEKIDKEFHFKNFFTRGLFSLNSRSLDPKDVAGSTSLANETSDGYKKSHSKKFFSRDWSWSRSKGTSSSSAQIPITFLNSTKFSSSAAGNNSHSSSRTGSRVLKYWWTKRSQSAAASAVISTSGMLGNDKTNRLVLLEKVPAVNDQDSDDMTVYVGERGESLTKYVLTKQILRHHLFQVLLKCSQDELGSDYDYNSGVPIICDPALFLQVARVVGGNFSAEPQLCRFVNVAKPTAEELLQCTLQLIKTQAHYSTKRAAAHYSSTCDSSSSSISCIGP